MHAVTRSEPRLARLDVAGYQLAPQQLDRLFTPALVVYEAKVRANVARMVATLGDDPDRWRVHLKTTKIPEVWALLLDAGLRAFKCATVREARVLLELLERRGTDGADLLIAYPLQGPALARAGALAEAHPRTRVSVLTEDAAHAAAAPEALGVFVDVNPGMHRTGIPMAEAARIVAVARAAGARLRGIHFYDGHVHQPSAEQRRAAVHSNLAGLLELLGHLSQDGIEVAEVVTSGTPSFRYALDFPDFAKGLAGPGGPRHRVSPGTVVFHDLEYDTLLEDLDLEPAAVVAARVVSHPRDGVVTCDAGTKSLAAEMGDPFAYVIGRPDLTTRSPSEEHLPLALDAPDNVTPALGDVLYLVPRHVCPTVNLAEQALWVAADGTTSVVEVIARAHDLLLDEG